MDVEDVAAGGAAGPHRAAQGVAADDGAVPDDERVGQAGLHRGEGDPAWAEAEDAVGVDLGHGAEVRSAPGQQTVDPGPEVGLRRGQADPVLETVVALGRGNAVVNEQEPRDVPLCQAGALLRLARPADQHDVHDRKR